MINEPEKQIQLAEKRTHEFLNRQLTLGVLPHAPHAQEENGTGIFYSTNQQ